MAVERNPFKELGGSQAVEPKVVPITGMAVSETEGPTFEVDDDGSITVNFEESDTLIQEFNEDNFTGEENWHENIAEKLDEDLLQEISADVIDKYQTDKDSREEWESMFERGFDLLGLKLETTAEPFEGACTAVHPLLIESAVKFQSKLLKNSFLPLDLLRLKLWGMKVLQKYNRLIV